MRPRKPILELKTSTHGGKFWQYKKNPNTQAVEIIDFSASINPIGPPESVIEAIKRNLHHLSHYPDSNSTELKKELAKIHNLHEENLIVGNGSNELIRLFAETFFEERDEVIIPLPTFDEYVVATEFMGAIPIFLELKPPNFTINSCDIIAKITDKTKAIFLCNPNNPTSKLMPPDELQNIVEKANEKQVLVFLDEVFIDTTETGVSYANKVVHYPNVFIIHSLTKIFALPGLRVGYGLGSKELISYMNRAKLEWNVNYLAQISAIAALKDVSYLEKTKELFYKQKRYLIENLAKIRGLKTELPDANYFFVDVSKTGLTGTQLEKELRKFGILVRNCLSFKPLGDNYIRIGIRTENENKHLLEALNQIIQ
ncbi:MAG: pyridoxal phosphate-dependent aminotransferase [Promethearchaeota archaeon]